MPVYVDELRQWPTKIRCFKPGSCHLTADTLEELHAFAKKLGLRREWFQAHRIANHYDLTPSKRVLAVKLGAVEETSMEQYEKRKEKQNGNPSPATTQDAYLFNNLGD